MFNKETNKIVIMLFENVMSYPPVLNLTECLLNNSYQVCLVAENLKALPQNIKDHKLYSSCEVCTKPGSGVKARLMRRFDKANQFKATLKKQMQDGDILWTVNPLIVRTLGKDLVPYQDRQVMQLFELMNAPTIPLFSGSDFFKFNLMEYAQNAWKNVVAERNRAYIQKVQWGLEKVPYVIPNKPYDITLQEPLDTMLSAIEEMKNETRKIIIYLGVLDTDRDFVSFAKAIEQVKDEYCLYMFGKRQKNQKKAFDEFCKTYQCIKYMGFYNPPHHLHFLQYAHMALVPYAPGKSENNTSGLNALYCAPNKIYEYAGSKIPMVGTDVLGLREPFEKYNIGVCCDNLEPDTIIGAIRHVDAHHDEMISNCEAFYNSVDLDNIVNHIIND